VNGRDGRTKGCGASPQGRVHFNVDPAVSAVQVDGDFVPSAAEPFEVAPVQIHAGEHKAVGVLPGHHPLRGGARHRRVESLPLGVVHVRGQDGQLPTVGDLGVAERSVVGPSNQRVV